MRRFHLPPEQCQSDRLALTGGEAHHAADVLRLRPGERVTVLDGVGGEFICRVGAVERKKISLEVENFVREPAPACRITLVQAIPKGHIFDAIVQKATELGVWRVVPLLSERVATRLEGEAAEHKREKWQQTAVEAIKQCGQRWLPRVEAPVTLPAWLARGERFDLALVGSLEEDRRHAREYFAAFERARQSRPASVCVWIGPEGDFAPLEMDAIKNAGALPMTLGPLVLRSETAAVYALSIINYELQAPR
ncbi:MAG: 16S rRNA (uracil(1498)-N(3))-methyltransferase [Verrucomicrobiota bacterium]|jgi:16S rRNA (uracil1498-N3)-methyltransferase